MRLAIIIASVPTMAGNPGRSRRGYRRESPGSAQIVVSDGRDLREAWKLGFDSLDVKADWYHFGSDTLEPHPGWFRAARSGGGGVTAPVLWGSDGTRPDELRDWTPVAASVFPTMTCKQVDRYGIPPLSPACGAEFALRTQYAFTII